MSRTKKESRFFVRLILKSNRWREYKGPSLFLLSSCWKHPHVTISFARNWILLLCVIFCPSLSGPFSFPSRDRTMSLKRRKRGRRYSYRDGKNLRQLILPYPFPATGKYVFILFFSQIGCRIGVLNQLCAVLKSKDGLGYSNIPLHNNIDNRFRSYSS